jgi:hypothetical protein
MTPPCTPSSNAPGQVAAPSRSRPSKATWPSDRGPTLARSVIELAAPQLRPGAMVVNDNGEEDYIAYVRNPANGFLSMPLPLKGSTELSIRR